MLLKDTIQTAVNGVTVNKTRSMLTMLGIIIGVASVVLMVSLGNSFQNYIVKQVESFGTNTIDVFPQGFEKFGGNLDSLTFEDYEAVRKLSTVEHVVPVVLVAKPVKYGKEEASPLVMGTRSDIFGNYGLKLDHGRLMDQNDEDGAASVGVIGHQTAEDLFGNVDPVGKHVTIGESSITVIGELKGLGSALLADLDKPVFIPFTTARAMSGQKYLSYMTLKAKSDTDLAKQDVTLLLRQRHKITNPLNDPDKDDFVARSAEQVTQTINSVTLGLTVFLSLVAAISLLVGGIGIMNIMLVSVTERTREIGLRKAVGARQRDILLQFLFEALSLTLTGGFMGLVLGVFFGWFLSAIAAKALGDFPFILSFTAIGLALTMAVGTGLVFGLYPARRASLLSPMEALRYE